MLSKHASGEPNLVSQKRQTLRELVRRRQLEQFPGIGQPPQALAVVADLYPAESLSRLPHLDVQASIAVFCEQMNPPPPPRPRPATPPPFDAAFASFNLDGDLPCGLEEALTPTPLCHHSFSGEGSFAGLVLECAKSDGHDVLLDNGNEQVSGDNDGDVSPSQRMTSLFAQKRGLPRAQIRSANLDQAGDDDDALRPETPSFF